MLIWSTSESGEMQNTEKISLEIVGLCTDQESIKHPWLLTVVVCQLLRVENGYPLYTSSVSCVCVCATFSFFRSIITTTKIGVYAYRCTHVHCSNLDCVNPPPPDMYFHTAMRSGKFLRPSQSGAVLWFTFSFFFLCLVVRLKSLPVVRRKVTSGTANALQRTVGVCATKRACFATQARLSRQFVRHCRSYGYLFHPCWLTFDGIVHPFAAILPFIHPLA